MLSFSMPCCVQREAGPWVSLILRLPDGSDPMGSTAKARRAGGERSGGVSSLLLSCLEAASLIETVHRFSSYRMSPSTWLQLLLSPNSTISSPGPLRPTFISTFSFVDIGSPWIPRQRGSPWPTRPPSGEGEQNPMLATVTDLSYRALNRCPTPSSRPLEIQGLP